MADGDSHDPGTDGQDADYFTSLPWSQPRSLDELAAEQHVPPLSSLAEPIDDFGEFYAAIRSARSNDG